MPEMLRTGGKVKSKYQTACNSADRGDLGLDAETKANLDATKSMRGDQVIGDFFLPPPATVADPIAELTIFYGFAENEKAFQRDAMKRQDEALDDMGNVAGQLHGVSKAMGEELRQQSVMLDDVNAKTGDLNMRTEMSHDKVLGLIEDMSSCKKYYIMACLLVTFIILLFLTIYT
jgi:hypothetical protein